MRYVSGLLTTEIMTPYYVSLEDNEHVGYFSKWYIGWQCNGLPLYASDGSVTYELQEYVACDYKATLRSVRLKFKIAQKKLLQISAVLGHVLYDHQHFN